MNYKRILAGALTAFAGLFLYCGDNVIKAPDGQTTVDPGNGGGGTSSTPDIYVSADRDEDNNTVSITVTSTKTGYLSYAFLGANDPVPSGEALANNGTSVSVPKGTKTLPPLALDGFENKTVKIAAVLKSGSNVSKVAILTKQSFANGVGLPLGGAPGNYRYGEVYPLGKTKAAAAGSLKSSYTTVAGALADLREYANGRAVALTLGGAVALNLGTESADFSGDWGAIKLTGKVTGSNGTATISLGAGVSAEVENANISNTGSGSAIGVASGAAVSISGVSTLNTKSAAPVSGAGSVDVEGDNVSFIKNGVPVKEDGTEKDPEPDPQDPEPAPVLTNLTISPVTTQSIKLSFKTDKAAAAYYYLAAASAPADAEALLDEDYGVFENSGTRSVEQEITFETPDAVRGKTLYLIAEGVDGEFSSVKSAGPIAFNTTPPGPPQYLKPVIAKGIAVEGHAWDWARTGPDGLTGTLGIKLTDLNLAGTRPGDFSAWYVVKPTSVANLVGSQIRADDDAYAAELPVDYTAGDNVILDVGFTAGSAYNVFVVVERVVDDKTVLSSVEKFAVKAWSETAPAITDIEIERTVVANADITLKVDKVSKIYYTLEEPSDASEVALEDIVDIDGDWVEAYTVTDAELGEDITFSVPLEGAGEAGIWITAIAELGQNHVKEVGIDEGAGTPVYTTVETETIERAFEIVLTPVSLTRASNTNATLTLKANTAGERVLYSISNSDNTSALNTALNDEAYTNLGSAAANGTFAGVSWTYVASKAIGTSNATLDLTTLATGVAWVHVVSVSSTKGVSKPITFPLDAYDAGYAEPTWATEPALVERRGDLAAKITFKTSVSGTARYVVAAAAKTQAEVLTGTEGVTVTSVTGGTDKEVDDVTLTAGAKVISIVAIGAGSNSKTWRPASEVGVTPVVTAAWVGAVNSVVKTVAVAAAPTFDPAIAYAAGANTNAGTVTAALPTFAAGLKFAFVVATTSPANNTYAALTAAGYESWTGTAAELANNVTDPDSGDTYTYHLALEQTVGNAKYYSNIKTAHYTYEDD